MKLQSTRPAPTPFPLRLQWKLAGATIAVLAIAAAVAVTLVVVNGSDDGDQAAATTSAAGPGMAVERDAAATGSLFEGSGAGTFSGTGVAPAVTTVYIVESPEVAQALSRELADANRALIATGQPTLIYEVVVLATAEEEARYMAAHAEADLIRGVEGLPPVRLVDLR